MQRLKVVQIGIGHAHATSAFNSILRQPELFEVVGFAVPEEEEEAFADRIAEYRDDRGIPKFTVEEALNYPGVDGAVIETKEINLTKYATMAAEKGLHIHMDKPGGFELSEFEHLIELVREKKLAFSIGYMYRFNPKIMEAMEKIKHGEIGEVYCVEAHMDCEHNPQERQEWLSVFPGGMMFYLGCHLVDLIYRIMGEPKEVLPLNCSGGFDGVTSEDFGMAVFRYEHGVSFAKTCAFECGGYMRRQLVICGTKGTFELKPLEAFEPTAERDWLYTQMREVHKGQGWQYDGGHSKSEYFNRFDDMLKNYGEVALGRKENPYTYEYELGLYKLLLRACGEEL